MEKRKERAMNKNIYNRPLLTDFFAVVGICSLLLMFSGCMLFKKTTGAKDNRSFDKFTKQTEVVIDEQPKQLINNFQDMKENELVSWVWMQPGFDITRCQTIDVAPVLNYSAFAYPWAEEKIGSALKKMFGSLNNSTAGTCAVEVKAAIVDMRPRKKLISRLLPFEEDYTYIEMQIVIVDKNSQELLGKLSHGKRSENFKDAVEGMMANVEAFFLHDVVKKSP
jgi:hypothetical protein